jgi:SAM-dependent methyltransferase
MKEKKNNLKFWKTFYKIRYCPSITKEQTKNEVKFVKEFLPIKRYKNILDFMCGFGRHSIELASAGYTIEGFDIDKDSIDQAKRISRALGLQAVKFYTKDARTFQKLNSFDSSMCLYSSIGFFDKSSNEKIFKNLLASVKIGGRIILDLMNPEWAVKNLIPYSERKTTYKKKVYFIKHWRKIFYNPIREENIIEFLAERNSHKYLTSYTLRLYNLEELEKKFRKNNFRIFKKFGSFNQDKISQKYQRIIIVADKTAA